MIGTALSTICITLGACFSKAQLQFRVFSANATRLEVCLFTKPQNQQALACVPLERDARTSIWTARLDRAELERLGVPHPAETTVYYGYRAWGPNWPYDPAWRPGRLDGFLADVDADGNRFNPNKLLLDPYALDISHGFHDIEDLSVFESGFANRSRDSGLSAPKAVLAPVVLPAPPSDKPTRAFKDDVIYEVHVKGLTANDSGVPARYRGTYRGAALKARYLKDLGITAVEFLPVHAKVSTPEHVNYWGYMTLGYFAPERSYAFDQSPGGPIREFREMVDEFHRHGIKVFIDVVYNHTGEGGLKAGDPTFGHIYSFRGLDNATYYDVNPHNKAYYMDNTGIGHNLATYREPVRDLVVDSLQYASNVLGVDGFRFDLAPVIGNNPREDGHFRFDPHSAAGLLQRIPRELPARPPAGGSGVDLIAEPWAIGQGTYQVGNFPPGWSEWNGGAYRDKIRAFYNRRGIEPVPLGDLAHALAGSSNLFQPNGRKPWNSVNFITAHDGFTMRDLFSYDHKRNDLPYPYGPSDGGEDHNRSWDQGKDPVMQRQMTRTALLTLLLSSGTPMINGGDEFYRTLMGNNNAYNLDTVGNWLDWSTLEQNENLHAFVRFLLRFRHQRPELRRMDFFTGADQNGNGLRDITWYSASGAEMMPWAFQSADGFLAYRVDTAASGRPSAIRSFYVAINGGFDPARVRLPEAAPGHAWFRVADTAAWFETAANFHPEGSEARLRDHYDMNSRCALLLVEKPVERRSRRK